MTRRIDQLEPLTRSGGNLQKIGVCLKIDLLFVFSLTLPNYSHGFGMKHPEISKLQARTGLR